MSMTVDIVPKVVRGMRGQQACFKCKTSPDHEAHWEVEGHIIEGNPDLIGGKTVISRCFNITKSMNVTCVSEMLSSNAAILPERDTGEIILIKG